MTFARPGSSVIAAALAALALTCGCGSGTKPQPLTQADFSPATRTENAVSMDPLSRIDQPGALQNSPRVRPAGVGAAPANSRAPSPIVQANVRAPGASPDDLVATSAPARRAASRPAGSLPTTRGASSGQYLELGGIVMEVNDTPIYANQVMKLAAPVFEARAPELDERQFRALAEKEIGKSVILLRDEQLQFAAAERNLDEKDKELADMITMQWRQKQINAAGGSLAVARQRAAAKGEDFDDLVKQQYRLAMSQIYYQREIIPKVQVTADEIRDYYLRHKDRDFTEPATARFRLIKVDIARQGGRQQAIDLITGLRTRIVQSKESFESIARSVNDEPRWLKSGGDLGTPIQKDAFAVAAVDQAVWATEVGQVTPVIDGGAALYLALVEEKKAARTEPFDESVQTRIDTMLRNQMFRDLRQKELTRLGQLAIVRWEPSMMDIALQMAMQNYPIWAGK